MSATTVQLDPQAPTSGEHRRQFRIVYDFPKVPAPKYRHAAPSAPWPWMNFDTDTSEVQPIPPGLTDDTEWGGYPQSLFGNWTSEQVARCRMLTECGNHELSTIYKIGVFDNGTFDKQVETRAVRRDDDVDLRAYWEHLGIPPSSDIRVQAFFVDDMTRPVLQILGTRYNVEPFFFASSVNWIPSRYQEDPKHLEDHITVVLPFIHILKGAQRPITRTKPLRIPTFTESQPDGVVKEPPLYTEKYVIDTQAPLSLSGKVELLFGWTNTNLDVYEENKILVQDLLSLHMVRKTTTSTIISYHPSLRGTSAKRLQSLVHRTGDSVYWSKIFKRSKDPTFLFLATLWYALYAWDEAFEGLFRYINTLEYDIVQLSDIKRTQELHNLQAHLSSYEQLLQDFLRSVEFVRDTPNPAMNAPSIQKAEREDSAKILRTEADNLITEIKRLTRQKGMLSDRLDNAIRLAFATVSIMDAKTMQGLAEVTVQDSGALKLIAYLSIVFLPATYLANVFSMNVREINPPWVSHTTETLAHYIEAVVGLTLLTSWVTIALHKESIFFPAGSCVLRRVLWPLFYLYGAIFHIEVWIKPSNRRSTRITLPPASDEEQP